jgi:PAS domain S-box-containing protein
MRASSFRCLSASVSAVRDLMRDALREARGGGPRKQAAEHALELGIEEIDLLWGEVQGQVSELDSAGDRCMRFFRSAPQPFVITDLRGVIVEANRAAAALLGAQPDALVRRPLRAYFAPEDVAAIDCGMRAERALRPTSWRITLRQSGDARISAELSVSLADSPLHAPLFCWILRRLA